MSEYDESEIADVPASEPLGSLPVTFEVPIPRAEQVTGEIAREILKNHSDRRSLLSAAEKILHDQIEKMLAEKATPIIEELLAKPIQPTDGYGNPIGEPTTLESVLVKHIEQWATTIVDREGKPVKAAKDPYHNGSQRLSWALGAIVNGQLKKQIDAEVARIAGILKEAATSNIAKQIAEKISGMVLK